MIGFIFDFFLGRVGGGGIFFFWEEELVVGGFLGGRI